MEKRDTLPHQQLLQQHRHPDQTFRDVAAQIPGFDKDVLEGEVWEVPRLRGQGGLELGVRGGSSAG